MWVTKMFDDRSKTDYQTHQEVRKIFPTEQRVLFQRLSGVLTTVSEFRPNINVKSKEITSLEDDQYLFSIFLNPVVRRNGRYHKVSDFRKWVLDKFTKKGLEIIPNTLSITPGKHTCYKNKDNPIQIFSVLVTGVLEVKDKENLLNVCQRGIGRFKFDGLGLLNIF
jgi:hypothetical protein